MGIGIKFAIILAPRVIRGNIFKKCFACAVRKKERSHVDFLPGSSLIGAVDLGYS